MTWHQIRFSGAADPSTSPDVAVVSTVPMGRGGGRRLFLFFFLVYFGGAGLPNPPVVVFRSTGPDQLPEAGETGVVETLRRGHSCRS